MKFLKNKIVIGIISIVLGLFIAFFVSPFLSSKMNETETVIRFRKEVEANTEVTEDMLQEVVCGKLGLPTKVAKKKEDLIGLYTSKKIYPSENLIIEYFKKDKELTEQFMYDNKDNGIVSITVPNLAAGLSGKIKPGDIVSVLVYVDEEKSNVPIINKNNEPISKNPVILNYLELKYVEVKAVTNQTAKDLEEIKNMNEEDRGNENIIPATVMLQCIDERQVIKLVEAENKGKIHIVFRGRGEGTKELLNKQKKWLDSTKNEVTKQNENNKIKKDETPIIKNNNTNKSDIFIPGGDK